MLSMKQAASRPRPPLPSAASGSVARTRSRSTPSPASASRAVSSQAEIAERLEQQPADQELEREVVDPLLLALIGRARRIHPAVDDAVAHGKRRRHEPVVVARGGRVLADRIGELRQDGVAKARRIDARRGGRAAVRPCGSRGLPAARLRVPLRLQSGVGLCHNPVVLLCISGPIGASPRLMPLSGDRQGPALVVQSRSGCRLDLNADLIRPGGCGGEHDGRVTHDAASAPSSRSAACRRRRSAGVRSTRGASKCGLPEARRAGRRCSGARGRGRD